MENTVFPRNDVITKLKNLITCLGTPTNFGAVAKFRHVWTLSMGIIGFLVTFLLFVKNIKF
jgi:hypothetical protein